MHLDHFERSARAGAGETDGTVLPGGFWLALAAGLALRAWYLSDLVQQPWFGYPLVDALTFDRTARSLLEHGQGGAFFRPPLYPFFLALLYRAAGTSAAAVAVVQGLLGLAALLPAYRLGERWFGRAAALAGVWVGACYPLRIFFEGELLDVTLFGFLFLWALWTLWDGLERDAPGGVLLSGLLLGAAAVTRPNVMIAIPFVALGAWAAFRGQGRLRPATAAVWALGILLAVAPTTLHNWRSERAFLPVAANGGVNFFLGNERGATGLTPVPPGLRWERTMLRPLREGHGSIAAQDRWWYAEARREIAAAPGRWLRLLGAKTAIFFNAAESSNNKALRHFTAVSFPVRHYRWWFGALVCLAALGCVTRPGRGALALTSIVAGYAASVALFFVAERYRLPLVPLLTPAAAAGAGELLQALRSRDLARAGLLLALAGAVGCGVFPDWFGAGRERIDPDFQMGQVYLMRGEADRALEHLERARAAAPDDPDVHNSLGAAHFRRGDLDAAEAAYRAALGAGDFGEVWYNLGIVAERRGPGSAAAAAAAYRRALAVNPGEVRARANLEALEAGAGAAAADPAPR